MDQKKDSEQNLVGSILRNVVGGAIGSVTASLASVYLICPLICCIVCPLLVFPSILIIIVLTFPSVLGWLLAVAVVLVTVIVMIISAVVVGVIVAFIKANLGTEQFEFLRGASFPMHLPFSLSPFTPSVPRPIGRLTFHSVNVVLCFIIYCINTAFVIFVPLARVPIIAPFTLPLSVIVPGIGWYSLSRIVNVAHRGPSGWIIAALCAGFWALMAIIPNSLNPRILFGAGDFMVGVVSAPIFEEGFKLLGLLSMMAAIRDEYEGVLYGLAVGLGFSLGESINYAMMAPFTIIIRPVLCIQVHVFSPCLMGLLIGFLKGGWLDIMAPSMPKRRLRAIAIAILVALSPVIYILGMIQHSVYNGTASIPKLGFILNYGWDFLIWILHLVVLATSIGLWGVRQKLSPVGPPLIEQIDPASEAVEVSGSYYSLSDQ